MSTAANHRKRSHRSQKAHYMAGASLYRGRVVSQQKREGGLLGRVARMIRRSRESRADVV